MKQNRILTYIIINLFLLGSFPAIAGDQLVNQNKQDKEEEETRETKPSEKSAQKPFFKAVGEDIGDIFTSPLHIKKKKLWLWGGTVLITGILIANDESIYRSFKDYQAKHKWVDDISPKVTKLGLGEWNLGIAGLFYLGGLALKDKKAKETARLTLMTFIHTSLVVQAGKHLFGRQRPSWEQGKDYWAGPSGFFKRYKAGELAHYDAFPSGHTISIFGTATVIAEMYKKTIWVPVVSYSLATLCGLSRITEDTHWLSDVFLGAVMGYVIGKFVVKRRNRLGKNKINIFPVATTEQVSLRLQYEF
jgi:membrane-associated phospholipid phosphatase